MSLSTNEKWILCDGEECQATASLPIALRSQLLPLHLREATANGWLFMSGTGASQHFCPRCAASQLERMVASNAVQKT